MIGQGRCIMFTRYVSVCLKKAIQEISGHVEGLHIFCDRPIVINVHQLYDIINYYGLACSGWFNLALSDKSN